MASTITQKLALYSDFVKFEHTVFALPFALSAMLLALPTSWPSWITVCWVVLTMVGGRTFAMGLNRLIDKTIDGKNPRTQNRALPAGRIGLLEAWALTLGALALMVWSTMQLPPLCLTLLPIAIAILAAYSYIKRFSNLAHLVLGLALGTSAIGGWIATTGNFPLPALLLGLAVMTWVAGFDIIYACQDVDFDRQEGLFSIPASWGIGQGLRISRLLHGGTIVCLIALGLQLPYVGLFYWGAVALTAGMLLYEQSLISKDDLSRVDEAFFTINGLISFGVFVLIALDKLIL